MNSAMPCASGCGTACSDATMGTPSLNVNIAEVYAPTAMNPAWPMENWPVKPFTRFKETASTILMPMSIKT